MKETEEIKEVNEEALEAVTGGRPEDFGLQGQQSGTGKTCGPKRSAERDFTSVQIQQGGSHTLRVGTQYPFKDDPEQEDKIIYIE